MKLNLFFTLLCILATASPVIMMAPYPALPTDTNVELWAALDAERKHYKRLIETQEKIAQTASKHYRDGKEEREVHCDLLKDWDKCEMVWVESTEHYREVLRRPMTAEERQGSFLEKPISVSPGDDDVIDVDAEEQQ